MKNRSGEFANKPEVVVVSGDIALNARLQKLFNENNFAGRGFFNLWAAVNWSATRGNQVMIFLLIPPFENTPLHKAISSFFEANNDVKCVVLVDQNDIKNTKTLDFNSDYLEILPQNETTYDLLPVLFRQMFLRMEAERQLKEMSGKISQNIKLSDQAAGQLTDSNLKQFQSEEGTVADPHYEYVAKKKELKILLAEDDAINQMYLAGFLRSQGWEVDAVYNGLEALKLLNDSNYDLIILDGQMPRMDGFETVRKIREIESKSAGKNIPILAISGYANPEDKERFFKSGMDAFLSKPVDEHELIRVIHNLTK